MDGCVGISHLEEAAHLNNGEQWNLRTPSGGPSAPTRPVQKGTSPAYVKENIDMLRTMFKDMDNRGKKKAAPWRLSYEDYVQVIESLSCHDHSTQLYSMTESLSPFEELK